MDPATMLAVSKVAVDAFSAFRAKKGQEDANTAQMVFNAAEAQKDRDFQERMFSTRYQVTRKDLEAAGYNPLLALGGGIGTPGGSTASIQPKSTESESSMIMAQTAKSIAEMHLTNQLAKKTAAETGTAQAISDMTQQFSKLLTSPGGKVMQALGLAAPLLPALGAGGKALIPVAKSLMKRKIGF